jgi:hypothetical protein
MFFTERKVKFCRDSNVGICKECGEEIDNVLPNEENIHCPECDEFEVVGIDKAIACGLIEIMDEKDILK